MAAYGAPAPDRVDLVAEALDKLRTEFKTPEDIAPDVPLPPNSRGCGSTEVSVADFATLHPKNFAVVRAITKDNDPQAETIMVCVGGRWRTVVLVAGVADAPEVVFEGWSAFKSDEFKNQDYSFVLNDASHEGMVRLQALMRFAIEMRFPDAPVKEPRIGGAGSYNGRTYIRVKHSRTVFHRILEIDSDGRLADSEVIPMEEIEEMHIERDPVTGKSTKTHPHRAVFKAQVGRTTSMTKGNIPLYGPVVILGEPVRRDGILGMVVARPDGGSTSAPSSASASASSSAPTEEIVDSYEAKVAATMATFGGATSGAAEPESSPAPEDAGDSEAPAGADDAGADPAEDEDGASTTSDKKSKKKKDKKRSRKRTREGGATGEKRTKRSRNKTDEE
jgi:hypothetical protein